MFYIERIKLMATRTTKNISEAKTQSNIYGGAFSRKYS